MLQHGPKSLRMKTAGILRQDWNQTGTATVETASLSPNPNTECFDPILKGSGHKMHEQIDGGKSSGWDVILKLILPCALPIYYISISNHTYLHHIYPAYDFSILLIFCRNQHIQPAGIQRVSLLAVIFAPPSALQPGRTQCIWRIPWEL